MSIGEYDSLRSVKEFLDYDLDLRIVIYLVSNLCSDVIPTSSRWYQETNNNRLLSWVSDVYHSKT